jgi:hypothetical protein
MKKSSADEFPGFAPAHRSRGRIWPFFTACFLALGVTCFVLLAPVVMFAMAVINGLLEGFGSVFGMALVFIVLSLLPTLAELFLLLQTGQYVELAMRILGTLSSR